MKKLNLNAIRIDGGTQSRVEINNEAVSDYAEAVKVGIEFPPVIVFHDGADHWLADGFHRYHAHKHAGKASITAEIRNGTLEDAQLFASGANGTHGLRRTNADKRKAVEMTARNALCKGWSDRQIAEHCAVSVPFVGAIRRPEVADKQREQRAASAERKAVGRNPITPQPPQSKAENRKSSAFAAPAPAPADDDRAAELAHTVSELAQENEELRDKLAVESLMDSEEAKSQTAETIRELRAQVKTLGAELDAVKVSRDTYMRENAELKKQVAYWRKQAEKAQKAAA